MSPKEIEAMQKENEALTLENKKLTIENGTLTKANEVLKEDKESAFNNLKVFQDETLEYKKEMEKKLSEATTAIAPEKTVIVHDGKQFIVKAKSILIPGRGKIDLEKLKDDTELIELIVTKYPSMVTAL